MTGRILASATTFLIPVVLARIFEPAQFGAYKQLFLIFYSVYGVSQMGMASSLFYFLPSASARAGHYIANSTCFLGAIGLVCYGVMVVAGPGLSRWFRNPELSSYLPWLGLYTLLMMLSATIETVLVTRGEYAQASAWYGLSDLARAVALILPGLLFRQIRWVLLGAVACAFGRAVLTLYSYLRLYRGSFTPHLDLLKAQLNYALPFGLAVLAEILQSTLPQYVVSHLFDAATFAIFAVGCTEIPLVDYMVSPTADIMMVKMREHLAVGDRLAVLEMWHDTTRKLALLFFPVVAFVLLGARELIVLVYTDKYLASVPVFMAWSSMIFLVPLQVDAVLRVFAQTRFILVLNLVRLAIIAVLINQAVLRFGLVGAAVLTVGALVAFKIGALLRIKSLLQVTIAELLPWRRLAASLSAAGAGATISLVLKLQMRSGMLFPFLALAAGTAAYVGLVWYFGLITSRDKLALQDVVRTIGSTLRYGKALA
jgi:O-antigen/teichoic acid export membrane protein